MRGTAARVEVSESGRFQETGVRLGCPGCRPPQGEGRKGYVTHFLALE